MSESVSDTWVGRNIHIWMLNYRREDDIVRCAPKRVEGGEGGEIKYQRSSLRAAAEGRSAERLTR